MNQTVSQNMFRSSPRQIVEFVEDVIEAGGVSYIKGSPGIGKSSLVAKIADDYNLALIDHRLSTSEPTDMSGLPTFVNGKAVFAPFEQIFPLSTTPVPKGKNGFLLFLDEYNHAHKQTQAATYKVLLDRMVANFRLHPDMAIILAGNLDSDRANVNAISTALESRVTHLEMTVVGHEAEWIEDVALPHGYDHRIVAYLSMYNGELMDFRPDHEGATFCCPRTWHFMSNLIKGKEVTVSKTPLYAGTITSGSAAKFSNFCQIFHNLVTVPMVVADPAHCPVPNDLETKWATVAMLMEKIDEKNFEKVSIYVNRFSLDFRVLFYRATLAKYPKLRTHSAFSSAALELGKYLRGVK